MKEGIERRKAHFEEYSTRDVTAYKNFLKSAEENLPSDKPEEMARSMAIFHIQKIYWQMELAGYTFEKLLKEMNVHEIQIEELRMVSCPIQLIYGEEDVGHSIEDGM